MRITRWLMAACFVLPAVSVAAQEKAPSEITAKDWSYQAVSDLAAKGLVHGYKDAKFLDGRKLSRFEMASLVKRLLDTVREIPVPADKKPLVPETPGTAAARGQGYEQPPLGRTLKSGSFVRTASFTEADLGTVKRLADAYSVELAVMGVDMQETMDKLGELEGRIETIESSLRDPEGPLQTVISNVSRIDKIRISGYVQARYQSYEETSEAVPSGTRRVQATDTFTLRRVRLTFAARPTDKIGVRWQFDGAGTLETRDAWIDYYFKGNPAMGMTATIGQMKAPFGFEVVQSSSVREAPERARVARFFFPDERDRGFKIASSTAAKVFWEVGAFNGIQLGSRTGTNSNDNNNDKNIVGRVRTSLLGGRLDVGASVDYGKLLTTTRFPGQPSSISAANPAEFEKFVYGADLQWFARDGTVIRAEWMSGKTLGTDASGYILQLIQNVGRKNQFVVKYDWFGIDDPRLVQLGPVSTPLGNGIYAGTLSNLQFGIVHHLDSSTRLKLFYEIHGRGQERVSNTAGTSRVDVPWLGNVLRFEVISLF